MKRLGVPRDVPFAVQQWQGLIAVNYPARAAGITRHMRVPEALKACPALRLAHVETIGGALSPLRRRRRRRCSSRRLQRPLLRCARCDRWPTPPPTASRLPYRLPRSPQATAAATTAATRRRPTARAAPPRPACSATESHQQR
jgi:nucleotidyltransferase/DNA polymerase involved in DNA repair